jgi:hypothetical protein
MSDGRSIAEIIIKSKDDTSGDIPHGDTFRGLAQHFYKDETRWKEIEDFNKANNPTWWYEAERRDLGTQDGEFDDEVLLCIGDVIYVPLNPLAEEEEQPQQTPGKVFYKKQWTGVEYQTPIPRIEIFLPSGYKKKEPAD